MEFTPAAAPKITAFRRTGSPRRVDVPAQDLEQILPLLRTLTDDPQVQRLVERYTKVLQPRCYWSSPRRSRWGSQPAWGMCRVAVELPSQRCLEHSHWPLREGAADPWPDRCETTLDAELDEPGWERDSAGLRCPYEKAPGSTRCLHHGPHPDTLCGFALASGEPCPVPEVFYPCAKHRFEQIKLADAEIDRVAAGLRCSTCSTEASAPCTARTGRPVALHIARKRAAQKTERGKELLERKAFLSGESGR
ncbi:hypothetical protein [Kitasatospora sp. CB01950]|uniref:hypothetical protein n=1 Tax=Kitasatospora sp. CB01950 TaxID=1703930 RepID=UPI00093EF560|nr:hypothetical protein [Kitasatospora sp. CB01950]OKI95055.1 hypothetical protein AMK19_32800 [Kitasatospora sp. CB01950]